jgi:hypothetical protein
MMAWRAFLQSVGEVQTVTDSVDINVEFRDVVAGATVRSFTKSYKLVAGNFQSLQAVRDAVTADVAQLTKLDTTANNLLPFIGQRIDQ